jgi:pimeloyl-ACP methyl ester carboxylesterase
MLGAIGRLVAAAATVTAAMTTLPRFSAAQGAASPRQTIQLRPCRPRGVAEDVLCGAHEVYENRATKAGRRIALDIVVIPATEGKASAEPVFYLAGGPGQDATGSVQGFVGSRVRRDRAIVLVDQRGTSQTNGLRCPELGRDDEPQTYLESLFQPERIRRCRETLASRADLRQYGTENVIGDLEEIRRGLGYRKINLWGISGGTRTAFFYLAMHPEAIHAVVMAGVVAPQFRNPLPHARSAQDAFDKLVAACGREAACASEFPDLHAKLDSVLARLARHPARAKVRNPANRAESEVDLDRDAFADGIRTLMYGSIQARLIPALIASAYDGDFSPAAGFALARARALRGSIAMGVLLGIVCSEDISRIKPEEIDAATRGTFIGRTRVDTQMAACREWPSAPVARLRRPMRSSVPTLLLNGEYDPVTAPEWADSGATYLSGSAKYRVQAGHAVGNPCTEEMIRQLFASGSATSVDASCLSEVRLPPFAARAELQRMFPAS